MLASERCHLLRGAPRSIKSDDSQSCQLKGSVLYAGNGDGGDHDGPYPNEKDQGLCSGAAGRPVIPGEEDLRLLQ